MDIIWPGASIYWTLAKGSNGVKRMYSKVIRVAGAGMLILAMAGCSAYGNTANSEEVGLLSKYKGPTASGLVEATDIDLNSKIPGKVDQILVEEGQAVHKGQVIARLTTDEIKAKENQAKALVEAAKSQWEQAEAAVKLQQELAESNVKKGEGALKAAQSQLDKAKTGARSQEVAQAQAAYDLMQKTFQRVEVLYQKGAIPAQRYDEVKTQMEVSRQTLSMAKEGARQEDVWAAEAMVLQAQAGLDAAVAGRAQVELARQTAIGAKAKYEQVLAGLAEVQSYLRDAEIKAPIDGVVTTLYVDAGELISTGMPLATITDTAQMWVEVKVKESDLAAVKPKGRVKVIVANQPQEVLEGEVLRINKKPDFATRRATNDRGEKDILAYGVKIKLTVSGGLIAGVTAQVKFLLN